MKQEFYGSFLVGALLALTPAAAQPATATFGPQAQAGGDIFRAGGPPDIPACAICHGSEAKGLGTAPRLAGKPEDYLVQQLYAFQRKTRVAEPMNNHAWDMTDQQIRSVAAYLSQLPSS